MGWDLYAQQPLILKHPENLILAVAGVCRINGSIVWWSADYLIGLGQLGLTHNQTKVIVSLFVCKNEPGLLGEQANKILLATSTHKHIIGALAMCNDRHKAVFSCQPHCGSPQTVLPSVLPTGL